jgi:hypothetical protein
VTPTAFAHSRKELAARDARATSEPTFIPIHITPAVTGPSLDVALQGGRAVRIPPGFDPAHLQAVVAALEGEAC